MSESKLVLHCGARQVTRDELALVPAPAPTTTWFPLSHLQVVERVEKTLELAGFTIEHSRYALARHDNRFFGVLDLGSVIAEGVRLAIGIRNSTDKSLPIGFCAGSRCFVCDNLAFRSEVTIARKHTRNGEIRFAEALTKAVSGLHQFREQERTRVKRLRDTEVSAVQAESLILRAYEEQIVSHRNVLRVLRAWRAPQFEEFSDRTMWSLFNAFTGVLSERQATNAQLFAHLTIRLSELFTRAAGTSDVGLGPMLDAKAM